MPDLTPAFGRSLRRYLYSAKLMALLDDEGSGWLDGGCGILAEALRIWLDRPTSDLRLLRNRAGQVQHVMLAVPGGLLDGDGFTTLDEFLHRWEHLEHVEGPWLSGYVQADLVGGEIPYDPARSAELVRMLAQRFD